MRLGTMCVLPSLITMRWLLSSRPGLNPTERAVAMFWALLSAFHVCSAFHSGAEAAYCTATVRFCGRRR